MDKPKIRCPFCSSEIVGYINITLCSKCYTPHHEECWATNGKCSIFGCEKVEPRAISKKDLNLPMGHAYQKSAVKYVVILAMTVILVSLGLVTGGITKIGMFVYRVFTGPPVCPF